jgi:hypothetical protein
VRRDCLQATPHRTFPQDAPDLYLGAHTGKGAHAELLDSEIPLDEPVRRRADNQRIRTGQALKSGGDIWRHPQGQLLLPSVGIHPTHHD